MTRAGVKPVLEVPSQSQQSRHVNHRIGKQKVSSADCLTKLISAEQDGRKGGAAGLEHRGRNISETQVDQHDGSCEPNPLRFVGENDSCFGSGLLFLQQPAHTQTHASMVRCEA